MNYWRMNPDREARPDKKTCDIWYEKFMAFAGDFSGNKGKHSVVFRNISKGYGTFKGKWDEIIYTNEGRLLYTKEHFEHRIDVAWDIDSVLYDLRL